MSLKPWTEIASPHYDVLEGTFQQSEFAADITQVANGTAPKEYQDAEAFFSRTYITEGMRLLLISVAQRIAGQGGDPVVQLQTAFGGGKTHTMLAVYHLASRTVGTNKLEGLPPILDEAGVTDLPQARIAIIDGINLAPSQQLTKKSGHKVSSLWGELAWQLLGEEGLVLIQESMNSGTSPGKTLLIELLEKASPCVILMDELVAFLRQFEPGQHYLAGTYDSNLTFIQALTEAIRSVPNAILLASLPESELEVGGSTGQQVLTSLEKYFARVESVWKPVGSEEAFEIVRRRLFADAGDRSQVEGVCRQFSDFYRSEPQKFPTETQSNEYFERMCRSYPIHPEIFDRLYEDWSTLEKFQRTRGVLQYLAIVIHKLWNAGNRDALIMPGSLPLDDTEVRNKSVHYLPNGWEPVIEREIDGPRSATSDIDGHDPRFGGVQAAKRSARTIFLGSAPSASTQTVRGIETERILLGAVQPGQSPGIFEDVLKRLRDRLHYLFGEQNRLWFDTRPNLRREMESRKRDVSDRDDVYPLLHTRIGQMFGRDHYFAGIHVFAPSSDIPDEYGSGPRLVVLPPNAGYSRTEANRAKEEAGRILKNRGDQPRQKQNRLLFLAADVDVTSQLLDQTRTYIAWRSIVKDIEEGVLNQDISSLKQSKQTAEHTDKSLTQLVRQTYKWLIAPVETFISDVPQPRMEWEAIQLSPTAPSLANAIQDQLREEEWVIDQWSPIHLRNVLQQFYFKNGTQEVNALKVYQDCCHYLYLPRLVNDRVFIDTVRQGVESEDFFGFASGKEGDHYLGFSFGANSMPTLDEHSLLIERETAKAYKEAARAAEPTPSPTPDRPGAEDPDEPTQPSKPEAPTPGSMPEAPKRRYYGTMSVDPVKAKMDFATVVDEVVEQFTSQTGVDVRISVEIEATSKDGFDEALQRIVKENSNVLNFDASEFEED